MKKILLSIALIAILGACSTKEPVKEAPVAEKPVAAAPVAPPPPPPVVAPVVKPIAPIPNPLKDPANILSKRVILFEYDKDTVKDEFTALVQAHAKFLADNKNRKIRLEGHADERGSREYNMALGQRRADAVRKIMSALGANNAAMETISFGEDKPANAGHDEAAWGQNRRVEIVYDGE